MNYLHRWFFFTIVLALTSSATCAQVTTGTPPFGSFGGGPDIINLANLNSELPILVLQKPGRGLNFHYEIDYDSSVWIPSGTIGSQVWQPIGNWGWSGQNNQPPNTLGVYVGHSQCNDPSNPGPQLYDIYTYGSYVDEFGVPHIVGLRVDDKNLMTSCAPDNNEFASRLLTDGSGINVYVDDTPSATLTKTDGTTVDPSIFAGPSSSTERNGNIMTANSSGQFFDTLSSTTPVLTLAGTGTPTSSKTFTYTAPSGAAAVYTMKYTTYSIQTYFHCSGIVEYGTNGTTTANLVSEIDLPDNSRYAFTYEPTPGHSGFFTGRIASVTLPTGGTISYAYSGGGSGVNGITCTDGSAATLTRTTPDGTWTYAQVKNAGAASTTTINAPQLPYDTTANQTVIQFQGIYETQRKVYQGSTSGTLLQTINTCYNAATSPCTTTAITLPITQRTTLATLPGAGNLIAQHTDKFNSFGMTTETDDYDFATTAPFPLLGQTLITYAGLGTYLNAFTQTVIVKDGSGTIHYRQDTNYDQYASFTGGNCVPGMPNHDDSGHGCAFTARANATAITTYTDPDIPSGAITKNFTYDSLGNLRTAQVNCCLNKIWNYSSTTSYAYPDSVVRGTSAPTLTDSFTYDLHMGLILTSTDPNNVQSSFTYDNLGRPLTLTVGTTNPATNFTYNDYDNHSSFTPWTAKVCSPVQGTNTACQKTIMDNLGRPVTTQLLDGNSTLYSASDTQYDVLGRAYKVRNPYTTTDAYWSQTNFDALGRPIKTTLPAPDSSTSTISYTDNTVTTTDPALIQRKDVFDGLGRLTGVYEPDPANNNALTVLTSYAYAYNRLGEVTTVTQGSQTRTYAYDALGRVWYTITPEAGMVCFGTLSGGACQLNGYDSFDNLVYRTDARGVVTNYSYDTLNRLIGVSYDLTHSTNVSAMPNVCKVNGSPTNNANVCFVYGATSTNYINGRVTSMTDPSGSESYAYDQFGNITQLAKNIGTTPFNTYYAFNLANELTKVTYPSGRVVQQNLDTIGRLCSVGATGSTCTSGTTYLSIPSTGGYNPAGQVTAFNYGNGVAATFGYSNDRLQLTSLNYKKGTSTLFGLTYSYGAAGSNNGQLNGITDSVDTGRSVTYTYDTLYRLNSAITTGSTAYPKWGLSETYDRYGNRSDQKAVSGTCVAVTCPQPSVLINAATNRITSPGYAYDLSGNMTNDGNNTLTYDGENRSTSAANVGSSGTYTYDGNGLRVKKVSGSTTTVYIFSGSKVIGEYENGALPASPTREYIYGGGTLLAKIDSAGTNYYHQDHLSNRLITDSSGNTVAQQGHFPFGEQWYPIPPANAATKWEFTTYERDAESGNDYAMARHYVNRLARFSSADLLAGDAGNPQSLNRYNYVLDNPVNLTDPFGMDPCDEESSDPCNFVDGGGGDYGGGVFSGGATGDPMTDCGASACLCTTDASGAFLGCVAVDYCSLPQVSCASSPNLGYLNFVFASAGGSSNGSGPTQQQIIDNARSKLLDALKRDPNCLSFLGRYGANVLGTLKNISITPGFVSPNMHVQGETRNSETLPNALVPKNPSIVINTQGFFFTYTKDVPFQGGILLHELGHATGALPPDAFGDNGPATMQRQNDNNQALKLNCSKTLDTVGKN